MYRSIIGGTGWGLEQDLEAAIVWRVGSEGQGLAINSHLPKPIKAGEGLVDGAMFVSLSGDHIGQGQSCGPVMGQGTISSTTVNVTNRRGSV